MVFNTFAVPALDNRDPVGFFTTVADKMLRSTFGFGVTNIPVYTNGVFVYTPSVQRLLQLSANIYDATTNRTALLGKDYPSVFRPIFTATASGDLYITGYTNLPSVTGSSDIAFSAPFDAATVAAAGETNVLVNVYGVPWIIGAKKGFPTFNQFSMVNVVSVTRKLEVVRIATGSTTFSMPTATNQMYLFSISNVLGCSLWNSYANDFNGNITVFARDDFSQVLTNDDAGFYQLPLTTTNYSTINLSTWPKAGWASLPPDIQLSSNSFVVALDANAAMLTNAIYRFRGYDSSSPRFDTSILDWQGGTPPLPRFSLSTTNRLQVFILDGTNVIDYVHFTQTTTSLDINSELADPDSINGTPAYMWSTNLVGGVPSGVTNQLAVSGGRTPAPTPSPNRPNFWQAPPGMPASAGISPDAEKAFFSGFFRGPVGGIYEYNGKRYTNTLLRMQAPYTPTRVIYNYQTWQANDPLVHYLASDLAYSEPHVTGLNHLDDTYLAVIPKVLPLSLGPMIASPHFAPWGNVGWLAALTNVELNACKLQFKDPLVWRSDDWDFPAGQDWSLSALGRVHRGTPWQTVYLKASDVRNLAKGVTTWMQWTGNPDSHDALLTAPTNDWPLMGLLIPLLATNSPTQLLSVNDLNLTDWLNVLGGMTALTNSGSGALGISPLLDSFIMVSNSPQAWFIANAISQTRTTQPNQIFPSIGAMLQTAELTENSPWLNWNDSTQQQSGISDEAYEAIACQLLPLLRPDSAGAMIQTNGGWNIRFSGCDSYGYALQTSTDLVNWISVSTNYPAQGGFNVPIAPMLNANRFYRSVLLP
ncbi:MAG: hypothetical protein WCH99_01615 [Verrucomicrobiota bacterium]